MNPNKFSFSRFASFFRWYAVINKKSIIKISAGTALGAFLGILILNWYSIPADNTIYQAILLVMSGVASSMVFSEIDKQPIRQQFLSIPASRLEKYISTLLVVIIRIVGVILALYIADFMRAALQFLKFKEFTMVIHNFNDTVIPQYPSLIIIFCFFNLTAGMSVRKYAFLYGSMLGIAVFMPSLKFVITAIRHSVTGEGEINIYGTNFNWPILVAVIFLIFALVFNYFSIFKRIQKESSFFQGNYYDYMVPISALGKKESPKMTMEQHKHKILKKYSVKR